MADDRGSEATSVTRRHSLGEEDPDVGAIPGAGNLERGWHPQLGAGSAERPCFIAPVGFVEIDGEKMTSVVGVERINADGVLASQMVIDNRVGQRDELAMAAIRALDARLLANARSPFVGACRAIAGLAAGLPLSADRNHVGPPPEQSSEQGNLLGRGEFRGFRERWRQRLLLTPLDPVLIEQSD